MEQLARMDYLGQLSKEVRRFFAMNSATFFGKAIEDLEIGGYHVPKGWGMIGAIHINMRNPDVFDDPDAFDPERFTPEREAALAPGSYVPHGDGRAQPPPLPGRGHGHDRGEDLPHPAAAQARPGRCPPRTSPSPTSCSRCPPRGSRSASRPSERRSAREGPAPDGADQADGRRARGCPSPGRRRRPAWPSRTSPSPSTDGVDLKGWFIPAASGGGPAPTVLFVHGWLWNRMGNVAGRVPVHRPRRRLPAARPRPCTRRASTSCSSTSATTARAAAGCR